MKQILLSSVQIQAFMEVAILHYSIQDFKEKYSIVFETQIDPGMGYVDLAAIELDSGEQILLQCYHAYHSRRLQTLDVKVNSYANSYRAIFNTFLKETNIPVDKTEWIIDEAGFKKDIGI